MLEIGATTVSNRTTCPVCDYLLEEDFWDNHTRCESCECSYELIREVMWVRNWPHSDKEFANKYALIVRENSELKQTNRRIAAELARFRAAAKRLTEGLT